MKKRSQIKEIYKWDLTDFCANDEEFYQKCEKLQKNMKNFEKYRGNLKDKETIYKFLKDSETYEQTLNEVIMYAACKNNTNLSDSKNNELYEHMSNLYDKFSENFSFVSIELHKLSNKLLDDIISDKKFKDYDKYFKDIKQDKKHMLPDEVEKFVSAMNFLDGYSKNLKFFEGVNLKFDDIKDSKGKFHKLDSSLYGKYMHSKDIELRKNCFIETHKKFGNNIDFLASNYISHVKATCFFAKQRKYSSAINAALEGEEVTKEVYDNLITSVRKNLHILFKFFKKKKEMLGLKTMYNFDTLATIEKKSSKTYTYDEGIELLKKALAPLGEEYVSLIQKAKDERWIDVYPNEGKRSGAYESGIYGKHPVVFTNFTGEFESVSTLAHELGHAMHTYFTNKNQPEPKSDYVIFLAEIASTTNEMLLNHYMIKNAKSKAEKDLYITTILEDAKSTIYRQVMFAEFEDKVHAMLEEGKPVTKDVLNNSYFSLNKDYHGKGVKLVKELQYEWARIPHFFNDFYVYKYAIGLLCAINFTSRILSGERGAIEDYFHFLSSGCKDTPIAILKEANCDVENENTFNSSFKYLEKLVKEL